MEIVFLGHASFKIRGKDASVVTDPFDPEMVGLAFPKVAADIVTVSHDHHDHNQADRVAGNPFVIRGPGEYEIKGVAVYGLSTFHDEQEGRERGSNTVYIISLDGLKLVHLGDLGHELSQTQLEQINDADVLMIPVGGVYTIDAQKAVTVVNQIEPRIIIPMHYKLPGLTLGLAGVEEFLTAIGAQETAPQAKLSLSRESLPQEPEVVVLAKKG